MVCKRLLCPERTRKIPKQFSWLDHRLVRDRHIDRCSHPAAALYLFLVTVADARGLSYYSTGSICQRLGMDGAILDSARQELTRLCLIAYQDPLYQVLDLQPRRAVRSSPGLSTIGQIFKQIGGGGHD